MSTSDPTKPLSVLGATQKAEGDFNIPKGLLQGLGMAESYGLNQYDRDGSIIKSPTGPRGAFQFTGKTARQVGIDPNNAIQNVLGAAKYLRQNYEKLKPLIDDDLEAWLAAAVAHDRGPGAVQGMIKNRKFMPSGKDSGNGGDTATYAGEIAKHWADIRDGVGAKPGDLGVSTDAGSFQMPAVTPRPEDFGTPADVANWNKAFPNSPVEPRIGQILGQEVKSFLTGGQGYGISPSEDMLALTQQRGQPQGLSLQGGYTQVPDQSNVPQGKIRVQGQDGKKYLATQTPEGYRLTEDTPSQRDLEDQYQGYLKSQNLTDAPENRATFNQSLDMAAKYQNQLNTTSGQQTPGQSVKPIPGVERVPTTWKSAQSDLSQDDLNKTDIKYQVQVAPGDTIQKAADRARAQIASDWGLTPQQAKQLVDVSASKPLGKDDRQVRFSINRGQLAALAGQDKVNADYKQEQIDPQRQFLEQTNAQNAQVQNTLHPIKGFPQMSEAEANVTQGAGGMLSSLEAGIRQDLQSINENEPISVPTYDEQVQREQDRINGRQLSPDTLGWLNLLSATMKARSGLAPLGGGVNPDFAGPVVKGVGGLTDLAAGGARALADLGVINDSAYEALSKPGTMSRVLDQQMQSGTTLGKISHLAGELTIGVPEGVFLSELPGGPMVMFGLHGGLQKAGEGGNVEQIGTEVAKQTGLAGALKVGSMLGDWAEDFSLRAQNNPVFNERPGFWPNAPKFIQDLSPERQQQLSGLLRSLPQDPTAGQKLVAKLFGTATTFGSVAALSGLVSKASGSSNEDATKDAIQMGLLSLIGPASDFAEGITKVIGKAIRFHTPGGETIDVTVEPDGTIRQLKGLPDDAVDVEGAVSEPPPEPGKRGLRLGTSEEPAQLNAQNPKRINEPDDQAVAFVQESPHAQRILDVISDGKPYSLEQLQKATRFSKANLTTAIENLYGARNIQINPDNTIQLIGKEESPALFDQFDENGKIENPVPQQPAPLDQSQNVPAPEAPAPQAPVAEPFYSDTAGPANRGISSRPTTEEQPLQPETQNKPDTVSGLNSRPFAEPPVNQGEPLPPIPPSDLPALTESRIRRDMFTHPQYDIQDLADRLDRTPEQVREMLPDIERLTPADFAEKYNVPETTVRSLAPLGAIGNEGYMAHRTRAIVLDPANEGMFNELSNIYTGGELRYREGDYEGRGAIANALLDRIAQSVGRPRASQMTEADWQQVLNRNADKMSTDSVAKILDTITENAAWRQGVAEFKQDPRVQQILQQVFDEFGISTWQDFRELDRQAYADKKGMTYEQTLGRAGTQTGGPTEKIRKALRKVWKEVQKKYIRSDGQKLLADAALERAYDQLVYGRTGPEPGRANAPEPSPAPAGPRPSKPRSPRTPAPAEAPRPPTAPARGKASTVQVAPERPRSVNTLPADAVGKPVDIAKAEPGDRVTRDGDTGTVYQLGNQKRVRIDGRNSSSALSPQWSELLKEPADVGDGMQFSRPGVFERAQEEPLFTPPYTLPALKKLESFRGREVKRQTIEQTLKQKGTTSIEQAIFNTLMQNPEFADLQQIPFNELEARVKEQIMPLRVIESTSYADYGLHNLGIKYDNSKTLIFNTALEHGKKGHFSGDFGDKGTENFRYDAQGNELPAGPLKPDWEMRQVTTPDGRQLYAAVRTGVHLTEDNIADNVGTASENRETVWDWMRTRLEKGGENAGLFGHSRIARSGDLTYITEDQSDAFQKNDAKELIAQSYENRFNEGSLPESDPLWDTVRKIQYFRTEISNAPSLYSRLPQGLITAQSDLEYWQEQVNSDPHYYQQVIEESKKQIEQYKKEMESSQYKRYLSNVEQLKAARKELAQKISLTDQQFVAHRKNYVTRILRETIRREALAGQKRVAIPTPLTLAIIEGYTHKPKTAADNFAIRLNRIIRDKQEQDRRASRSAEYGGMPYEVNYADDPDELGRGDQISVGNTDYTVVDTDGNEIVVSDTIETASYRSYLQDEINSNVEEDAARARRVIDDERMTAKQMAKALEDQDINYIDADDIKNSGMEALELDDPELDPEERQQQNDEIHERLRAEAEEESLNYQLPSFDQKGRYFYIIDNDGDEHRGLTPEGASKALADHIYRGLLADYDSNPVYVGNANKLEEKMQDYWSDADYLGEDFQDYVSDMAQDGLYWETGDEGDYEYVPDHAHIERFDQPYIYRERAEEEKGTRISDVADALNNGLVQFVHHRPHPDADDAVQARIQIGPTTYVQDGQDEEDAVAELARDIVSLGLDTSEAWKNLLQGEQAQQPDRTDSERREFALEQAKEHTDIQEEARHAEAPYYSGEFFGQDFLGDTPDDVYDQVADFILKYDLDKEGIPVKGQTQKRPALDLNNYSGTQKTILEKYVELNDLFRKERHDAEDYTDEGGNEWILSHLTPDDKGDIVVFNKDLEAERRAADMMGEVYRRNTSPIQLLNNQKATYHSADGYIELNPDAGMLFRMMLGEARGDDPGLFWGIFMHPIACKKLLNAIISRRESYRRAGYLQTAKQLDGFYKTFKRAFDENGDLTAAIHVPGHDKLYAMTLQEEFAHRADLRGRGWSQEDLNEYNKSGAYRTAAATVRSEYPDYGPQGVHNEVVAKIFRSDALSALKITADQRDEIEDLYILNSMLKRPDPVASAQTYLGISSRTARFVQNVQKQYRSQNSSNAPALTGAYGAGKGYLPAQAQGGAALGAAGPQSRAPGPVGNAAGREALGGGDLEGSGEAPDSQFAKYTLVRRALDAADKLVSDVDLSSSRALENAVNKNLQQIKLADEDVYEQIVKLATSEAQATVEGLINNQPSTSFIDAIKKRNLDDVQVSLQVAGLAIPVTKNSQVPAAILGKAAQQMLIGNRAFYVPKWLAQELTPVLDKPGDRELWKKLVDAINLYGMSGPVDLFFHSMNVIGALIACTPYAGTDVFSRTVGNFPAFKWLTVGVQLWLADPEKVLRDDPNMLREMAEAGVIPEGYGAETYNPMIAGKGSAKLVRGIGIRAYHPFGLTIPGPTVNLGPILKGPKGIDIRARIVMWKIGKHMNPNATPTEMFDFVNQLGTYTKALQSDIVRFVTTSRFGIFAVAGTTMTKNGILAMLNKNPFPNEELPFATRTSQRLQQQFSGGLLGMIVVLWIGLYLLYLGKFPWQDEKSQFLKIPLKPEHRNSALIRAIFGDQGDVYVNVGFASPLIERGGRALGIQGAYNTAMLGGNKTQMFESGLTDMANAAIEPVSTTPTTRFLWEGFTGNELSLKGLRDDQGQSHADFWRLPIPKDSGMGRKSLEAALDVNPFIGGIFHSLGVNRDQKDKLTHTEIQVLLQAATNVAAPKLLRQSNTAAKKGFVQKQKAAMNALENK